MERCKTKALGKIQLGLNYRLLLSQEAESDIQEAVEWYENQRGGLGFEFALAFEESLQFLETNPKIYAAVYKEVRSVSMKKFPYSIFFIISDSENEVKVFAVVHTSRNPDIWQTRSDLA